MIEANQRKDAAVYESMMSGARREFATRQDVAQLFGAKLDPDLINLFMIYWSSMSAALTRPIPEYLCTAGRRSEEMGLTTLAMFFKEHTEEEDGHHMWAESDTRKLVAIWNEKHPGCELDAEALLSSSFRPSVRRYHQLHEDVLASGSPWAELAIDIEIELITTQYGPPLLAACAEAMDSDGLQSISFLSEHVRFDFGHTETNLKVVGEVLRQRPDFLHDLVDVGQKALVCYGDFLGEALELAKSTHSSLTRAA